MRQADAPGTRGAGWCVIEKYRTILADPPWSYRSGDVKGAAAGQYPTMDDQAIAALPVGDLAARDAVLFLWATWPKLPEALAVIRAWGFTYLTGLPWIKIAGLPRLDLFGEVDIRPQYGVGYWFRGCSEALLIARRGDVSPPTNGWVGLLSRNLRHSRKPDDVYAIAESLPGPYLELFCRRKRAGWASWGNEVSSDLVLGRDREEAS